MKKMIVILALLLLPINAYAQIDDSTMQTLIRMYDAAQRIEREVWLNNPNKAEALRHMILIAQDHNLPTYLDTNAWNIDVDPNPQGCRYFGWYDENGEYHWDCNPWSTFDERCYTISQIQHYERLVNSAHGLAILFAGGAAITAIPYPFAAGLFGIVSVWYEGYGWFMEREVMRRRELQCP